MSGLNEKKLIQVLEQVADDLKSIHEFKGETYYTINRLLTEINSRIESNVKKVEVYQQYREDKSVSQVKRINLGLDIASENFGVINTKNDLTDIYFRDIYKRIEILGQSIIKHGQIVADLVQRDGGESS